MRRLLCWAVNVLIDHGIVRIEWRTVEEVPLADGSTFVTTEAFATATPQPLRGDIAIQQIKNGLVSVDGIKAEAARILAQDVKRYNHPSQRAT